MSFLRRTLVMRECSLVVQKKWPQPKALNDNLRRGLIGRSLKRLMRYVYGKGGRIYLPMDDQLGRNSLPQPVPAIRRSIIDSIDSLS